MPELQFFDTHPSHPATKAVASQFLETNLLQHLVAHTTPKRPYPVFVMAAHPSHIPAKCPHGGCSDTDCKGNRFERTPGQIAYSLHMPHNKTGSDMCYPLPASLNMWAHIYFDYAWPLLAEPGVWQAFITPANGIAISPANCTTIFQVRVVVVGVVQAHTCHCCMPTLHAHLANPTPNPFPSLAATTAAEAAGYPPQAGQALVHW